MPFEYSCAHCGKQFYRKRRIQGARRFCSTKCYHDATKTGKEVICATCEKVFYIPKVYIGRRGKYCSQRCYFKVISNRVTKVCPVCSKTFSIKASEASRYTVCSWACKTKNTPYVTCERCGKVFTNQSGHARRHCSEKCRRPPVITACKNCGEQFRHVPGRERQFCSFSCYRAFQGETKPERKTRTALNALNLEYIQEAPIGRYSVDFLLPGIRVALEVDGVYWHQDKSKDERKTRYLRKHGWRVCRITDMEIGKAGDSLDDFLFKELQKITTLLVSDTVFDNGI